MPFQRCVVATLDTAAALVVHAVKPRINRTVRYDVDRYWIVARLMDFEVFWSPFKLQ
ncbi:MAG: hypothetical protein V7677_14190 [Motiliproteus sp.]